MMLPLLAALALPPDWAKPADEPLPVVHDVEEPPEDHHSPAAHMYISRKAFEYYRARYPDSELGLYIDEVAAGARDEDKPYLNPFNEAVSVVRHFWDPEGGPYAGLWGSDSAVNRAHKYLTGGFGLGGGYDDDWGKNGTRGEGAVALHAKDRKKAYWYLGHMAHLLEDLTVPAHVQLWQHAMPKDRYESYMKDHHEKWDYPESGPVEDYADLYSLYRETALVTDRFDAGRNAGLGADGSADRGARRKGGFTQEELDEEAAVLAPLGVRKVAALYRFFYKQLDKQPPQVRLELLAGRLHASAVDGLSGVDRLGYKYWLLTPGGWVELAAREAEPGSLVKATAVDAAGNVGESPVVVVGSDALAVRPAP